MTFVAACLGARADAQAAPSGLRDWPSTGTQALPGEGAERTALSADGSRLYLLTPFPHQALALDRDSSGQWREVWRYAPPANQIAIGWSCCDREDHGPVQAGGQLLFTTLDGHVVALDKADGKVIWQADVASAKDGETLAGPPRVDGGRIFVGLSADEAGRRGQVIALDSKTGRTLWRRYSTGPDDEVGIGPRFDPADPTLKTADLGRSTWPGDQWQSGGGGVAGPILVDADRSVIIHGTGHPAPWNAEPRSGLDRWTSGLFARDAATGAARWFIDFNPGNPYAFRDAASNLLTRLPGPGGGRAIVVHPDANGWLYVIDRDRGRLLSADALVPSVVASVDIDKGTTAYVSGRQPRAGQQTRAICPSWMGAFGGAALDPHHPERVVLTIDRTCMDFEPRPANALPGTPYVGANVRLRVPSSVGGQVLAWDLVARRVVWRIDERWPVLAAPLVTASGRVVYGTLDGRLEALDAGSGQRVATARVPSGIVSTPLGFTDAQGQPSVAVVVGTGRIRGMSAREALDERDGSAGFGVAGWMASWPLPSHSHPTLMTFRLP